MTSHIYGHKTIAIL